MAAPSIMLCKGTVKMVSAPAKAEGLKGKERIRKLMQNKGWSWVELPQAFLPRGQMAALALCRSPGTSQPEPRCHMAVFA